MLAPVAQAARRHRNDDEAPTSGGGGGCSSSGTPPPLWVFGDSYADTGNLGDLGRELTHAWYDPYGDTFPGRPTGRFSDGRVLTDFIGTGAPTTLPAASVRKQIPEHMPLAGPMAPYPEAQPEPSGQPRSGADRSLVYPRIDGALPLVGWGSRLPINTMAASSSSMARGPLPLGLVQEASQPVQSLLQQPSACLYQHEWLQFTW